jgi:hypothetical protein
MIVTQASSVFSSHFQLCTLEINHHNHTVFSSRQRSNSMQHPLPNSTLSLTRDVRQINIPTFIASRQSPDDTMCPCADLRRQIRAMFSGDMCHQRVRARMNRTRPPLCCAEKTAVRISRSESVRRMLVGRVATSAEGETVAHAVSEIYALQEPAVAVGGVEVAGAAFPAWVQLV